MKKICNQFFILSLCVFVLGGCALHDLDEPTKVTQHRVELEEKTFLQEIDTELLTEEFIK